MRVALPRALSAVFLALALLLGAVSPADAASPERPALDDAGLLAAYGFAPEDLGYVVFDLATGETLRQHNADGLFIPASVAKLPTAVTALDALGGEHRFETTVLATSAPSAGVVRGDLYLRGGGNPLLDNDDLEELVLTLKATGVRQVAGGFYYDDSMLPRFERIEPSQPYAATYNPAVGALTLNFNRVQVRWDTDKRGRTLAEARAISKTRALPIGHITFGTAAAAPEGAPFLLVEAEDTAGERWLMSPRLKRKGHAWLPIRDPGAAAAEAFRSLAATHGIVLPSPRRGTAQTVMVGLAQHRSEPLAEIARLVLKYSNNLAAELVGLAASQRLTGERLGLRQSGAVMEDWLREAIPYANWEGFHLANHSGLSSTSRVTPAQMAEIVRYALTHPHGGVGFAELLPPIRWEGEVNEENDTGPVDLRVRAKTGTMSYGRGLAGYLQTASGRTLGFAVFLSDLDARAEMDARADPRILLSPPEARAWTKRARELEKDLVTAWLMAF